MDDSKILKRAQAIVEGRRTWILKCSTHGLTDHNVTNDQCRKCFRVNGEKRSARQQARSAGERHYMDDLGRLRSVMNDSVVTRPREPASARLEARHAGASTYQAECRLHGVVPHHTIRGRCLTCFNSLGRPRPAGAGNPLG